LLHEDYYHRQKRHFRSWKVKEWMRGFLLGLVTILIILGLAYALKSGSSHLLIGFLTQRSFPFEAILMEGIPGYSQPERVHLDLTRNQGAAVGMFLLTGVNIADPRTFFLGYFSPPSQGPVWLGWAYNPNDPEHEGPILEPIEPQKPEVNAVTPPTVPVPGTKGISVGIYHTHNSECYAGDGGQDHRFGENGDIVSVGETLKKALEKNGIGAVHSLQIHDAVEYMKAYSKSVVTATQLIKDYPSIKLLLDVHRNGLPPGVQSSIKIKGQSMSRVLIVIGKQNPYWQKNEALAKELIALGEKKYPGLFMPNISYAAEARYNQHLSEGALLLEFGSQYNVLEESNRTAEAVAEVIADYLKIKS
jgi:stage II sporulation protein P